MSDVVVQLDEMRQRLTTAAQGASTYMRLRADPHGSLPTTQNALRAAVAVLLAARLAREVGEGDGATVELLPELERTDEYGVVELLVASLVERVGATLSPGRDAAPAQRMDGRRKYPFDTIPVGCTFRVPTGPGQPSWSSFRVHVSKTNRLSGKHFLCHRYPDGTYEVWRQS